MIHPLDWSVRSIYKRLRYGKINELYGFFPGEEEIYLSYLKPDGKIVLDIGAYNGDSAKLFLEHGAKFVHCIEIVPDFTPY
jgi:hypothetical protein